MKQITLIVMAAFALALTPVASAANDTKSITIQVSIAAEASIVLALSTDRWEGRSDFPPSWPETRWEGAGWMVSLYPMDVNPPSPDLEFA